MRLLNGKPQNTLDTVTGRDCVSRWKGGDRPALEILLKLTEHFKCTLDDLTSLPLPPDKTQPTQSSQDSTWELESFRQLSARVAKLETEHKDAWDIINDINRKMRNAADSGEIKKLAQ